MASDDDVSEEITIPDLPFPEAVVKKAKKRHIYVLIIVAAVLVVIALVAVAWYSWHTAREARRELSLNAVCENFREIYKCNLDVWDSINVRHAESSFLGTPNGKEAYTLHELCAFRGFNRTQCRQRCNCTGF